MNYLAVERLEPKNVRLLVRISREYRHLISDTAKTAEKLRLGRTAVGYAKRAAALGTDDSEAQLAVAIGYGKLQPFVSTKEKVETSRIIKDKAHNTNRLYRLTHLAWHVLGCWTMGYADITGIKRSLAELTYGKLPRNNLRIGRQAFRESDRTKTRPNPKLHRVRRGLLAHELHSRRKARPHKRIGAEVDGQRRSRNEAARARYPGRAALGQQPAQRSIPHATVTPTKSRR